VAETLDEFRGQYRYNLMDEPLRRFNAEVPMLAQWDDHEVTNNWYWEMRLDGDARYREGSVALLAARGMRAFHEYMPVRRHPLDPERIFDRFPTARCSKCSASTCAAIAGPTRTSSRPR
jgi:alkaline phosphatase D